ncbi:MAG: hypothetical protein VR70_17735 [Rhodospirillaceae bacterium BRH_c57]|nr:MAG: hypothetical protein VR70_17735 [Rhodospirillaceae bacterium BRH_c57]
MVKKTADGRQLEFDVLFDALPDIAFRDQRDALERPLVSLSKNPRTEPIEYWFDDLFVRIIPNQGYGQPTIWDYDIIIYLLGQVNTRFKHQRDGKAEPAPRMIKVEGGHLQAPGWEWEKPGILVAPKALLTAIGRGSGGRDFEELRAAIGRLQSCMIETNIWHGKKLKRFKRFSLIHDFEELEPSASASGGMRFLLPDWMIDSVKSRKGIFTIHPSYFDLAGGYERFLYRIARKYVGRQAITVPMKMATLREKSGSPMILRDFAKSIRKAVAKADIPEYHFCIERNQLGEEILKMRWLKGLKSACEDDPEEGSGNDTPLPTPPSLDHQQE